MDESILKYYERELSYIREMGAEFAQKYPKIAGRLSLEPDKSEDPHTERLIEAFSFLCGRIHQKIDDDFPQITESLFNVIYPHYVNPIPSMSVVQFVPILESISELGYEIAGNTKIFSEPVGGEPCHFKTSMPVNIWPIEIVSAGLKDPKIIKDGSQQSICLELKVLNNFSLADLKWQKLRFFLSGQSHHVYHLYELLLNNVCSIECEMESHHGRSSRISLDKDGIVPVGFGEEESLIPHSTRSFPGYRLLSEYFCFPEKFLFFELNGLNRLADFDKQKAVKIWFHLNRLAKPNMVVDKDTFRLNATPVINLFTKVAEPIRVEHEKTEYRVVPSLRRSNSTEVYSIENVTATLGESNEIHTEMKPFYSIRHHLDEGGGKGHRVYWHMQRRMSGKHNDKGTEVYISFVDLDFKPKDPDVQVLTVRTTCSNRDLPSRLSFGNSAGDFNMETAAPMKMIRCLLKPTPARRTNLGGSLQWKLISHFSLNYLSIVRGGEDALKEILTLYNFDNSASTKQQINGITGLRAEHVTRRIGPSLCRGVKVTLELDEDKFVGAGLFLFASIIERLLGQYVSLNSFSQLVLITRKNKEVIKAWPPRSGNRSLL
jgi:type VI secretion system protein ImpG